jgi:hypothetical protein
VRDEAARADREITNGYERQAVITAAAYLLEQAGLGAESDALLKANLAKSHSPYYLMSGLAGNAKRRGDNAEALRWYREAGRRAKARRRGCNGARATSNALVELAPADEAAIEARRCSSGGSGDPARRLRAAQRPLAAARRQEAASPGARAARTPRRWRGCAASSTRSAPRPAAATPTAPRARRC